MVWGNNDVGKSCLMFQIISKLQDSLPILFTDAEYKYDPIWAMQNGVNPDLVSVLKPDDMEQYMNILRELSSTVGLSIVDSIVSVAASGEQADKKGVDRDMHDDTIALQARKLSQFFRVSTATLCKNKVATILLNQIRTSGIGGYVTYDAPPGGHALMHYCHQIIKVSRRKTTEKPIVDYSLNPSHDVYLKVTKGINETVETNTTFFTECGFDPLADLVRQLINYRHIVGAKKEDGTGKQGYYSFHKRYADSDTAYRFNDMYPVVEEKFEHYYKLLMETEHPLEEVEEKDE